jgi:hypothetical protein
LGRNQGRRSPVRELKPTGNQLGQENVCDGLVAGGS